MGYILDKEKFITMDLKEMRPDGFLEQLLDRNLINKKMIDNGQGWLKRNGCPICGFQEFTHQFSKFDFNLRKCCNCSTGFFEVEPANPNDLYSSIQALDQAKIAYLSNKDYRKVRFAEERIELIKKFVHKDFTTINLLDVGCGTGWFLERALEEGANCYGLELGKQLAEFTSNRLKIDIWNCDLTELETNVKFDVITMFDLIEHVKDPIKLLEATYKLLNPGGIVLIFTPNFDSLGIQTMKDKSSLIMPAEHLSYFTKGTVDYIINNSNFNLSYYATKGIDIGDLSAFEFYLGNLDKSNFYKENYDLLQPSIDAAGHGNHMRFILKK